MSNDVTRFISLYSTCRSSFQSSDLPSGGCKSLSWFFACLIKWIERMFSLTNCLALYYHVFRLLLDYDGTLLPYERSLSVRAKGKTTNEEMLKIIKRLAADPRNVIYIMSGRTRQSLENIFGSIESIGLCAEGGCFLKPSRAGRCLRHASGRQPCCSPPAIPTRKLPKYWS